jgi:hypothetical protein
MMPPDPPLVSESSRFGLRRYSAVELLVTLILFFAIAPFVDEMRGGDLIATGLLIAVMVAAVCAVRRERWAIITAVVLLVLGGTAKALSDFFPGTVPLPVALAFGLMLIGFVFANLLGFILRAARVNAEVLCAGISAYLMLGLFWMLAYMMTSRLSPRAFAFSTGPSTDSSLSGFDACYFSFITLCTVGYGDIVPVSRLARTLAMLESVVGTLFITVLIARLVAMYAPQHPHHP